LLPFLNNNPKNKREDVATLRILSIHRNYPKRLMIARNIPITLEFLYDFCFIT